MNRWHLPSQGNLGSLEDGRAEYWTCPDPDVVWSYRIYSTDGIRFIVEYTFERYRWAGTSFPSLGMARSYADNLHWWACGMYANLLLIPLDTILTNPLFYHQTDGEQS